MVAGSSRRSADATSPQSRHSSRPRRSHGPQGDEEGHDQRCLRLSDRREDGVEGEAGAGGVRRVKGGRLRGGGEDGEVHYPAAGDAEVEAQGRTEGREEDDVWKGGAGGSKASRQGGQGLPRQEPEGLHLRCPSAPSTGLCPLEAVLL